MCGRIYGRMYGCMYDRIYGRINGRTYGRIYGRMSGPWLFPRPAASGRLAIFQIRIHGSLPQAGYFPNQDPPGDPDILI